MKILLKKICVICHCEFETYRISSVCCSRSCAAKECNNRPETKEKISIASKNKWADPLYKEKMQKTQTIAQNRESVKLASSIRQREYENRPDVKIAKQIKMKEVANRPGARELNSERQKIAQSNPEIKFKHSIAMIEYHKNPIVKEQISKIQSEIHNRVEIKQKYQKLMIEHWSDINYANEHIKKCFKYKEFILPSGKIVKIQGYEPTVLNDLLTLYTENDIAIGIKEINKEIGKILYEFQNVTRSYYPDFYIKSTNTIIEVKSKWSYNLHKEKNLAKQKACLEQGFNFEFVIL